MRKKFLIFFVNILFLSIASIAVSENSSDPKEFIQEIVDDAKKILVATNSSEYKTEIMMLYRMASNLLKPRSEWFSKILNDYNKNRFPDYEIADHMYSFYLHIANILGERIISLKEG